MLRATIRHCIILLGLIFLAGCGGPSTARPLRTASLGPSSGPSPTMVHVAPFLFAAPTTTRLSAPISRAVVLVQRRSVVIAGGVDQSGQSASGIFRLQPQSGALSLLGTLADPVHDAAGAVLRGQVFVFGGGAVQSTAEVQRFAPSSGGVIAGRLPSPRSDLASVVLGRRVYVVGGYDGVALAPNVLETTDGVTFRRVARLPIPIRYPAVVALDGRIFVFGGMGASGETAAIQEVDPTSRRARVVGRLPFPLSHASALVLRGHVYILGGLSGGVTSRRIWSFDPASARVTASGRLPRPISDAGAAVIDQTAYLIGGENAGVAQASIVTLRAESPSLVSAQADRRPFRGRLLIADRGNNRLLLVNAKRRILWVYPSASSTVLQGGFYFPDDAFFFDHGKSILVNEENNEVVVRIAFPSGKLQWSYGQPGTVGSADSYLHTPDDAYLLKNNQVVVADDGNCRVLFINAAGAVTHQIGTTGFCQHQPPSGLGSPNGDTPLSDGNVLISEINGSWISEYTPDAHLVWTVQLPIKYPSDPQQIGPDRYLVADYTRPGGIYEFSRSGTILWSYGVTAGPGMLDHPSLAERLPNGLIAVSDDYRHRVVIINPISRTIVWQYGQTDVAGTAPGYLNTPDGFDLLSPDGRTPTHMATK